VRTKEDYQEDPRAHKKCPATSRGSFCGFSKKNPQKVGTLVKKCTHHFAVHFLWFKI
jgi:hypothetical protein